MPKSTSPGDRANSPSRTSSVSEDDEYTPHSRSDASQANRDGPLKRKRGRVNPAQLAYLERAYTADRSLDATRRKEISQKLGMDERQTQIWFQNRRAKAKMLAHRAKEGGGEPHTPGTPSGFSVPPTLEDIKATLQEDTPLVMVPCSDVLIGKWRRMNTGSNDLLVYLSECRRTLTYYVRSADIGFKMRIPFDSIVSAECSSEIAPGCDLISLLLNKPPTFYREVPSRAGSASMPGRAWRPANDWTEGAQASTCTRHEIIGPSAQLGVALGPLLAASSALTSSGVSNNSLGFSYFQSSPNLPYPSCVGACNSSTNSPPHRSSPVPYSSSMPMETGVSWPVTSNEVGRGDGIAAEPQHRRNRSQSQPPMHFAFQPEPFPQVNNLPTSPHSASLGSAGFPVPFTDSPGQAASAGGQNQINVASLIDQQQRPSNQTFTFMHSQSDVSLLPEHLTAARPWSSGGFKFLETASASQPGAAQKPPTPGGHPPQSGTFDGLTSLDASIVGPGGPANAGASGTSGPRFMDIYSSQNVNLSSYILGNNSGDDSRGSNSISPVAPTPTQWSHGIPSFSVPFALTPAPPSRIRMNDVKGEHLRSPSIYDRATERVAFPA